VEGLSNWNDCADFDGNVKGLCVARTYAGILGLLAFGTSLVGGVIHGKQPESVIWKAWLCLLAFSAVGWVLGWIAERTVVEALTQKAVAELAAQHQTSPTSQPPPSPA